MARGQALGARGTPFQTGVAWLHISVPLPLPSTPGRHQMEAQLLGSLPPDMGRPGWSYQLESKECSMLRLGLAPPGVVSRTKGDALCSHSLLAVIAGAWGRWSGVDSVKVTPRL